MMRDHGGNLDWAIERFGGTPADWIDLSTGINRVPYPVPDLSTASWRALPGQAAMARLIAAARGAYGCTAPMLALAGAQDAIQLAPRLRAPGQARVLAPTYNEHAACLLAAGWQVTEVADLGALAGADLAVVVNPNNPDGQTHTPAALRALIGSVGLLVVDESFADPYPALSLAADCGADGLIVLRSFGKFYGLAGLRLGFAIGPAAEIAALAEMVGPWPVSGAAQEIGAIALADRGWAAATTARLAIEADRIDRLAIAAGWALRGGTALFRLYDTGDADAARAKLARARIWSRRFPLQPGWLRLGLPGDAAEWARLTAALEA